MKTYSHNANASVDHLPYNTREKNDKGIFWWTANISRLGKSEGNGAERSVASISSIGGNSISLKSAQRTVIAIEVTNKVNNRRTIGAKMATNIPTRINFRIYVCVNQNKNVCVWIFIKKICVWNMLNINNYIANKNITLNCQI